MTGGSGQRALPEPGFSLGDRKCFSMALRYARGYALGRWNVQKDVAARQNWVTAYGTFKEHFRLVEAAGEALPSEARRRLRATELRAYLGLVFVTEAQTGRTALEAFSRVLHPGNEPMAKILSENDSYRKVLNVLQAMRGR